jgi:hypothetical protein
MTCFSKGFVTAHHPEETSHQHVSYHGIQQRRGNRSLRLINSAERRPGFLNWPPIPGFFRSVTATLSYMRHNRTQAELGESFGVSQPTISRAIKAI